MVPWWSLNQIATLISMDLETPGMVGLNILPSAMSILLFLNETRDALSSNGYRLNRRPGPN